MLAFIMLWAYVALSQLLHHLVGESARGNPLVHLTAARRLGIVGLMLAIFGFAVPFVLLLQARYKRDPRMLAALAGLVLVTRAMDPIWVIAPSFSEPDHRDGVRVALLAPIAIIGLGGVWLSLFIRQLALAIPATLRRGGARRPASKPVLNGPEDASEALSSSTATTISPLRPAATKNATPTPVRCSSRVHC